METLDFTHITPSGNPVEINVKNGDVVGYNGRSGYANSHAPDMYLSIFIARNAVNVSLLGM